MGRVSNVVAYALPEARPFDYQNAWLDDFVTRWLHLEKARQIGFSAYMSAFKGTVKAVSIPRYNKYFVSYNLDDSREKIDHAKDLYNALRDVRDFRRWLPPITIENKLELRFANGSRLQSVFTPRGKSKADIDIDEAAHNTRMRRIWKAALPIMIWGGQFCMGSSPTHSQTMFAQVGRREEGKYKFFRRAKVFWWDCPVHCTDVARARAEAPDMDTEARVKQFGTGALEQIFESMPHEDFQEEFELQESDDKSAYLPWDLILATTPSGEDAIKHMLVEERAASPALVEQLADEVFRFMVKAAKGHICFGGFDVGRRKNYSELSIFACLNERAKEIVRVRMPQWDFDAQETFVARLMEWPRILGLRIDETGLGMMLAERLEKRFGHRVVPVSFTHQNRMVMASNMKMLMEKQAAGSKPGVLYAPDRNANSQMHSVKKSVTAAGQFGLVVEYDREDAGADADAHADAFWSRALALWAWMDKEALGEANVGWA